MSRPFTGKTEELYPIPPPISSGKCGFWKFAGVLIPRKLRKQVRHVFALLSTADGIVGGAVQAVFAVVRRPDGSSPCDGRGVKLPEGTPDTAGQTETPYS